MAIITLVTLQGCAELPSLDHRHAPTTLQDTAATSLGRTLVPMQEAHAGKSWDSVNQDGSPPTMAQTSPRLKALTAPHPRPESEAVWSKDLPSVGMSAPWPVGGHPD